MRVGQWWIILLLLIIVPFRGWAQETPPEPTPEVPLAPAPELPAAPVPPVMPSEVEVPETPETPADAGAASAGNATPGTPKEDEVYLNVQDGDIRDIIKQVSKATGRNFIIDDKLRGRKLTILSERPMTTGELYQTFLSALNVAGYTVVEGPGGIYKVVSLNEAKNNPIPTHVDTIPISDLFITRLITLNNVGAAEMMRAIRDMVSRGGAISVYPQTNTLILTDAGTNIDRLMKIIKELDQEGPQQVMEIIPVVNATAKDIAAMVNQLFEQQKQGQQKPKPGEPVDIDEVSKLIPDERTNAIIVLASKRAMEQVRGIIRKLDQRLVSSEEGRIHVYYLKHARAKDLATTLATLTQEAGKTKPPTGASPAGGGPPAPILAEFSGEIKITADEAINALIITATYKDYKALIDRVISKLDVRRRQVFLEAAVMELRISSGTQYGVSGHGGLGGSLLGFGQSFGAVQGLQGQLLSPATDAPALLGGIISQQTVDITTVNPATGASSSVSLPAFSAFLQAISTAGDVNIISTPSLLTLDNEEAEIRVEAEEPIPGPQTVSTGGIGQITPVTYEKAGLTLKIKPQIGYGDLVNLEIEQELSTFGVARNPSLGAPSKIKRNVKTNVLCQDGQTIVIGGLMEDQVESSKRKIPILGDIPLLGFFFSHTDKKSSKSNLLIFITPHVVKDSTDFNEILKRKIADRNRFVEHNYGKRQQEVIRASIRSHREDLLEFKDGETAEGILPAAPMMPSPSKGVLPPGATAPQASIQPAPIPPIISAPPLTVGSGGGAAVPTGPVQATSKSAPVVQPPVWFPSGAAPPTGTSAPGSSVGAPIIDRTLVPESSTVPPATSRALAPPATITIPPAPDSRKKSVPLGY
ncbi:MAG: type II secretion system secretin GspD [Deltaproteobacteria bacterium]|nr:type II secretion system secretin GspD [Deltaproteobacteria bacterium]